MHRAAPPHGLPGVGLVGARKWQRLGWWLLGLFVLAAIAGTFGGGPLSHASVSAGNVRIDYERVVRMRAATELRIAVAATTRRTLQLGLELADPRALEIESLAPQPLRERVTRRGAIYEFETADHRIEIALRAVPRQLGRLETRVAVDGSEPLSVRQLVLP